MTFVQERLICLKSLGADFILKQRPNMLKLCGAELVGRRIKQGLRKGTVRRFRRYRIVTKKTTLNISTMWPLTTKPANRKPKKKPLLANGFLVAFFTL